MKQNSILGSERSQQFRKAFNQMAEENDLTRRQISKRLGITTMTLYNKINRPEKFTIEDLIGLGNIGIDVDKILDHFFTLSYEE